MQVNTPSRVTTADVSAEPHSGAGPRRGGQRQTVHGRAVRPMATLAALSQMTQTTISKGTATRQLQVININWVCQLTVAKSLNFSNETRNLYL